MIKKSQLVICFCLFLLIGCTSLEDCGRIIDENQRDFCYKKVAVSRKDEKICEKIKSGSFRDECYSKIAIESKKPDLCEKVENTNNKDSCYLFQKDKTKELCRNIKHNNLQKKCISSIKKNNDLFSKIISLFSFSFLMLAAKDAASPEMMV